MNENETPTLIVTVGLPRSGKSTWARQQGHPIVCPDAIRLAIHGERFAAQAEPWVWVFAFTMVEALICAGHRTIIVDATNVSAKRRDEWQNKFPDCNVMFQVFETDPQTCKLRALDTNQKDLLPVIDRMAAQWDLPKPESWKQVA